jgi:hypothetical protein
VALLQAVADFIFSLVQELSAAIAFRIASSLHLKQRGATVVIQFLVFAFLFLPLFIVIGYAVIYASVWLINLLLAGLLHA